MFIFHFSGMMFAISHPIPPLVSVRLRNLSDIILEQICDLRNVTKPDRGDQDKQSRFLIAVADWMAVGIEQVYYDVQKKKNEELDKIEKEKQDLDNIKHREGTKPLETRETTLISEKDEEEIELLDEDSPWEE